jgi:glycosyltransferase involved in cell wall biosynthesis
VHAHNPLAGAAAWLARWLARVPETAIVTTYHGLAHGRIDAATWLLRVSADLVVGIGPAATRELELAGLPADRLVTVWNATDVRATRSREEVRREFGLEDAELIVTVGRYAPEKRQELLLEAVAQLAERRPRLRALVVGERFPGEQELQRRVEALALGERVTLTGPRHDVGDLVAAADVCTLTSIREGLGLVLLEAMSVGTPVVGTDVGGIRDVIRDGETGLLVPPENPGALATALERLLDDQKLAGRLAATGRAFAEQTASVAAMTDGYITAYGAAIAARATVQASLAGRRRRSPSRRTGPRPSK